MQRIDGLENLKQQLTVLDSSVDSIFRQINISTRTDMKLFQKEHMQSQNFHKSPRAFVKVFSNKCYNVLMNGNDNKLLCFLVPFLLVFPTRLPRHRAFPTFQPNVYMQFYYKNSHQKDSGYSKTVTPSSRFFFCQSEIPTLNRITLPLIFLHQIPRTQQQNALLIMTSNLHQ